MRRVIAIIICLCMIMCGCSKTFSSTNGPVLDEDLLQTFPYGTYDPNAVIEWFESRNSYKIERTDELDNTIYTTYRGNVDWFIVAGLGSAAIDGYFVMISSGEDFSEEDWREIYNCVLEQLTGLGASPIKTWNNGDCTRFNMNGLQIDVRLSFEVTLSINFPT